MPDFFIKAGMTLPVFEYQCSYLDADMEKPDIQAAALIVGGMNFIMTVDEVDTSVVQYQFTETDLTSTGLFAAHVEAKVGDHPQAFPQRGFLVFEVGPFTPDPALFEVTPSPREVAQSWMMARTRNPTGKQLGTFTDDTSIKYEQALVGIQNAVDEVIAKIDGVPKEKYLKATKVIVTILAAANLELSLFPEQSAQANSEYEKLMDRYNLMITDLMNDIDSDMNGDGTGGLWPGAAWGFPFPSRWGTRPL